MQVIDLKTIKRTLNEIDLLPLIEQGFSAYSQQKAIVPPVGELLLPNHEGEVHIKYGYIKDKAYYVIKIASGFYANAQFGLPSSNGLMLLFKQATGEAVALLKDEGYLTDVRTAVAGAIAAKYLAPKTIKSIGIIGTGIQARLQLEYLKPLTHCRHVKVWGRTQAHINTYITDMNTQGFSVESSSLDEIASSCQLIVTTTPSKEPLLRQVSKGTHITAVGSDTPDKQELDAQILAQADILSVDSKSQCETRGESAQALKENLIQHEKMIELGDIISAKALGRSHDEQITVADLTGVAVQDIQIATAVFDAQE